MAAVSAQLVQLVEQTVQGLGYELVEVERLGRGLLRVTLDAPAVPGGIGVDDCERVSHQLTHLFAVEGVDYERLEVSSPGLDRKLIKPRDYERFVGHRVRVQLIKPVAGRRRLFARLLGVEITAGEPVIKLQVDEGQHGTKGARAGSGVPTRGAVAPTVIEVALADIERAQLVPELDFGGRR
ncbi:MAG: ribosome maturation factor RimP [Sutterellaceae bacterium]|nr:ribosome maturation factor RimP [Burkholderiaceae bacterium]MDW8430957.1 ribosome maturation factor RimP [Sutterellaceae bacterium]